MRYSDVIERLEALADPMAVENMARYGVRGVKGYNVAAPHLKRIAKEIGKDHALAQELWASGILDARVIAAAVDDPRLVTEEQMEGWVRDFDNWAVCDACCSYLFDKTPFAYQKAVEWSEREEEYVKRAGFVMMAVLAVHDKKADDERFLGFLPIIKREALDVRNFVKKAVNWALRQIGKRNLSLNRAAVETAEEIHATGAPSAKWIASDALKELRSEAVQERLRKREHAYR